MAADDDTVAADVDDVAAAGFCGCRRRWWLIALAGKLREKRVCERVREDAAVDRTKKKVTSTGEVYLVSGVEQR